MVVEGGRKTIFAHYSDRRVPSMPIRYAPYSDLAAQSSPTLDEPAARSEDSTADASNGAQSSAPAVPLPRREVGTYGSRQGLVVDGSSAPCEDVDYPTSQLIGQWPLNLLSRPPFMPSAVANAAANAANRHYQMPPSHGATSNTLSMLLTACLVCLVFVIVLQLLILVRR
jgi:hypothetical protein